MADEHLFTVDTLPMEASSARWMVACQLDDAYGPAAKSLKRGLRRVRVFFESIKKYPHMHEAVWADMCEACARAAEEGLYELARYSPRTVAKGKQRVCFIRACTSMPARHNGSLSCAPAGVDTTVASKKSLEVYRQTTRPPMACPPFEGPSFERTVAVNARLRVVARCVEWCPWR